MSMTFNKDYQCYSGRCLWARTCLLRDPAAEAAIQPQIWCFQSWFSNLSSSPEECFFTDTGIITRCHIYRSVLAVTATLTNCQRSQLVVNTHRGLKLSIYLSISLWLYLSIYLGSNCLVRPQRAWDLWTEAQARALEGAIYIYMYVCMYVYIYIYIYVYTHTYIHTHIYIYICSVILSPLARPLFGTG